MQFLEPLKLHIAQLDEKTFFAYIGGFFLCMILMSSGILYYYYSATGELHEQFDALKKQRSEMRALFEQEVQVKKQEAEVKKLLSEDPSFNIEEVFKKICEKLRLNFSSITPNTSLQLSGKYREYTLSVRFQNSDMKSVCELLEEIENNKRIYTKSIDIQRVAQSTPTKLNITLVIGTLLTEIQGGA